MKRLGWIALSLAPLLFTIATFTAVLATGSPILRGALPNESHIAGHCTWHCHNYGCAHAPRLPQVLAGDKGLYGDTIRWLKTAGKTAVPGDPNIGYGLVNLALFCAVWPGLMYALYLVAISQRRKIIALRRGKP